MPPPGGTRCGLDYFVSPQPSSLFLARPPYKSSLSCFPSLHVSSPFPLVSPPQQQQLHFIHSSLFVTWKGVSNNELLTYHPLRPPPCSSCLSTMVAAAGRRSSFPSSPTSHHSFWLHLYSIKLSLPGLPFSLSLALARARRTRMRRRCFLLLPELARVFFPLCLA